MMVPHQPHDAVREIQEAQKEQRAALEMLTKQLSQVAMSLGELRGSEGKIPATVQAPNSRENVNAVSLREETVYPSSPPSFLAPRFNHNGNLEHREQIVEKEGKIKAEDVTGIIQPSDLPPKKTDPGVFTLPISIKDVLKEQAMCDLGASINIMPYSAYKKIGEPRLIETDLEIQLADGSCIYPEGILENEIVKVDKFMYPADFFVVKMTEPGAEESVGILLGRPFLSTARTVIDVRHRTMNLEYKGERLVIDSSARRSQDSESIRSVDAVKPLEQKNLERELFIKQSKSTDDEELKKEAADWFKTTMTGEMSNEALKKAIMDFCRPTQPTETAGNTQLGGVERPLDKAAPLREKLKKNSTHVKQPLSWPKLPNTLQNLPEPTGKNTAELNRQEQGGQLTKELRQGKEKVKWKIADLLEMNPNRCIHPTMEEKGVTNLSSKKKELIGKQEELPSQCQTKPISRKQIPKSPDPHTTTTTHPPEADMHKGTSPDSFSSGEKGDRVNPYRDKTEASIVEEIPLTLTNLIQ